MGFSGQRLLPATLVLLGGLAARGGSASAWSPYRSESGALLRWVESDLLVAVATPPFDASYAEQALAHGFAEWGRSGCGGPRMSSAVVADVSPDAPRPSLTWVTRPEDWAAIGSRTELARTALSYRVQSGEIVDADISVNLAHHEFSLDEACLTDRYDLRYTLTHELGHLFGLDHSDVSGSTMSAKADEGDCEGRSLEQDDLDGYCALYPLDPNEAADGGPERDAETTEAPPESAESDVVLVPGQRLARGEGCENGPGSGVGPMSLVMLARSARRARRRALR